LCPGDGNCTHAHAVDVEELSLHGLCFVDKLAHALNSCLGFRSSFGSSRHGDDYTGSWHGNCTCTTCNSSYCSDGSDHGSGIRH
jgi:hypothetical protein